MAEGEEEMIFILVFLAAMGAWEAYVYNLYHYPEDILLSVMSFGFAFFLGALWLNGVGV